MTLTVGICDDCPVQTALLVSYLDRFKERYNLNIISSSNPVEFQGLIKEHRPNLVYLDVHMEAINGIELGEQIKSWYEDVLIIYITGFKIYAMEAFRVRAFHYLLKPIKEDQFAQVFLEAATIIQQKIERERTKKVFKYQRKGVVEYLEYDTITHFEKMGHKVLVHTAKETVAYYSNFVQLLNEIDSEAFIQCHQGFIINKSKVRAYKEKKLILEGDVHVPISRSFNMEIKDMLEKMWF